MASLSDSGNPKSGKPRLEYVTGVALNEATAPARHVIGVVRAIKARGYEVRVVSPSTGASIPELDSYRIPQKTFRFGSFRGGWRLYAARIFSHLLGAEAAGTAPDVYYFRISPDPLLSVALARLRSIKVIEVNGLEILELRQLGDFVRAANLLLVGTSEMATAISDRYPDLGDRILVQSNCGLSPETATMEPLICARQSLGLPQDVPVLLVLTGFQAHQDFTTVFDAARAFGASRSCILFVVGDGPQRRAVEQRAREQFQRLDIRFTGPLAGRQLERHIDATDVCLTVLTPEKLREGNGKSQKTIDYLARGKPVIETVNSHLPTPQWLNDFVFSVAPADAQALAEKMAWVCDHPEVVAEKTARARDFVLRNFSWDAVVRPVVDRLDRMYRAPREHWPPAWRL